MKTALFIGVSLTLVALPAAAQYARSGQSAGGYRGGNIPAAPSVSHKRYAALSPARHRRKRRFRIGDRAICRGTAISSTAPA